MKKRVLRVYSLIIMMFMICSTFNLTYTVSAAYDNPIKSCTNGIKNNGLGGIYININAAPYTTFTNIPVDNKYYGYTIKGCAWFASARVNQLTGKGSTIWSGTSWWNNGYAKLGFSTGQTPRSGSLICWSGHVAVLEKIEGNTAYISEGGYQSIGSGYGYCVISTCSLSSIAGRNSGFLGYVYFGGSASQPSPTPVSTPSNSYTAYVKGTDGSLAINIGPRVGGMVGKIPEGASCTVYPNRASGNWLWVTYNGVSGYSYKNYLSTTPPVYTPAPAPVPAPSNTYTAYVKGTDGSLAINSKPASGNMISSIPEGAGCTVDPNRKSGNWCWVTYNGVSGYSYSKYLTTSQPASTQATSNTRTGIVRGTDGTLVINSKPAKGNQIGLIPEGASCTVYPDKKSGNWYWVSYGGVSGYSYSKYIILQ